MTSASDRNRYTYGPLPKARTVHLLRTMLTFVAEQRMSPFEWEAPQPELHWWHQWKHETTSTPELWVRTTLKTLSYLLQQSGTSMSDGQIGDVLRHYLPDFLGILTSHTLDQQGIGDRYFTLTLWSQQIETNCRALETLWDEKRSPKSKEQDAQPTSLEQQLLHESTSDDGIIHVSNAVAADLLADPQIQAHFQHGIVQGTVADVEELSALEPLLRQWMQQLDPHLSIPEPPKTLLSMFRDRLLQQQILVVLKAVHHDAIREALSVPGMRSRILLVEPEQTQSGIRIQGDRNQVVGSGNHNKVVYLEQSNNSGTISISF
nr:hypothetical protein [Leptolyngbya sp. CCY15150]